MKTLYNYILEAQFSLADWNKIKYIRPVINALCNSKFIRLGNKGDKIFNISKDMNDYFQDEFAKLKTTPTLAEFNEIVSRYELSWGKIFKGDFSGYKDGLSSKNKGNAFEEDFIVNFEDYAERLADVLNISVSDLFAYNIKSVGGNNTKRPLNIKNNEILLGNKPITKIGDDVADVRLENNDSYYNLSLKCDKKVTFCNTGIKQLFQEKSFDEFRETGELNLTKNAEYFLNFFGIDKNRFAEVFINYKNDGVKRKSQKDEVDVTYAAKTPEFEKFLKSIIGCGYILVHKIGSQTHMYDLRTEKDLNDFIGNVQSMVVLYPNDGNKKAVDVLLNTEGLSILFNFRSKSGKIYPEHFMADYTIKKH